MGRTHLFLAPPGWTTPLGDELARALPGTEIQPAGQYSCAIDAATCPPDPFSLAFALQSLPNTDEIPSASIRRDADRAAVILRERLGLGDSRWRFHVFAALETGVSTPGRATLFRSAVLDALKRRAKGILSRLDLRPDPVQSDASLAQATWLSADRLAISVCDQSERAIWRRALSPWPGGVAPVPIDRRPPSRAYRKLSEALAQMERGIRRGERVVDLGASPGGWSFVALDSGANVVAVDRAPLRIDLMNHPRLRFVDGDAFRFAPDGPVDWMFADVAAYPERTLDLVTRWLKNGWCRNLVATVKFTGAERYTVLEDFKAVLVAEAGDFRVRKLLENKNEATVMAWRKNGNRAAASGA